MNIDNKYIKFYVILVETETSGNVGSVCRLMGNYDIENLVLINPKYKSEDEAIMLAHTPKGLSILKNKMKFDTLKEAIDKLNLNTTVGFTRRIGKNREISLNYRDYFTSFFQRIYNDNNKISMNMNLNIGLVFGRESSGLYTDEIKLCNLLLYIPTSSVSPSLNLSHAVGIVLNEIFFNKNFYKSNDLKKENKYENIEKSKNVIETDIYKSSRPKELYLNGKSGMKWNVENLNEPSTNEDRKKFYEEIVKVAQRKKLFVRNDYYTFKKLFERIFNQPYISKRDLNYLKSMIMRFIYADIIEKRKK